jgi:predicted DNA binding protein
MFKWFLAHLPIMRGGLKETRIAVFHQDCVCSKASAKFPEIRLNQASPVTILKKKDSGLHYTILWSVSAPTKPYLEKYLSCLEREKDTVSLDVLQREARNALVLQHVSSKSSSYEEVLNKGLVYSEPISVGNGYEIHTVLTKKPERLRSILNELESIGEIKLIRAGNLKLKHGLYNLTEKQLDALKTAYAHNYYSWPRKVRLEDLAGASGLTRRGFQESLRKAEAKVMPEIIKEILTGKIPRPG